jgi:hypothetical protein
VCVETVDQGRPDPASCVGRSNADLLDVGAPIDDVAEEIGDRVIGCVDRNPRVPGRDESLKLCVCERFIGGDLGHPDRGKCTARAALDVAQDPELAAARLPYLIHRQPTTGCATMDPGAINTSERDGVREKRGGPVLASCTTATLAGPPTAASMAAEPC